MSKGLELEICLTKVLSKTISVSGDANNIVIGFFPMQDTETGRKAMWNLIKFFRECEYTQISQRFYDALNQAECNEYKYKKNNIIVTIQIWGLI